MGKIDYLKRATTGVATRLAEIERERTQLITVRELLASLLRLKMAVRPARGRSMVEQHRHLAKRKTRTMTTAQKREVSVRMKRYWATRRAAKASRPK